MLTRREALAALASAATLPLMSGCSDHGSHEPAATTEADALALLDGCAENLLRLLPETATSLGVDTGPRAALRSRLADRSAEGKQRVANQVRADLNRVNVQSIAFRACRLVVDTGIHAKRWTREQGVAFFVDVNGSNPEEVASEVDRYCSWPGQACGYKVGHSEINSQRQKATTALGARFNVKAFNDTVVLGGNVPLDVLASNVDEYIRASRS
jgi:uncharacterized protein (DUF885 family)